MTGIVTSIIQGQTTVFDFTLAFVENGAFLSGGYQGTIDFVIVQISNLEIEIGIDWEGVPTLGFGAQIDVEDFDSSVMILLDSAVPTQSMFVASVSDITLATILQSLCNMTGTSGVPDSIMGVLGKVGLSGTNDFTIADTADTVAASLNSRDVAAVSAAFATAGISLSTDSQEVIVSVADEDELWYVTDMVNILHYQLKKSGAGAAIQGSLEAQFYVVPQTTQLGSITAEQGFRLNGTLDLFGFKSTLTVQIEDAKGLWIECAYSPMIIAVSGYPVLSVQSDDGTTGPMAPTRTARKPTLTSNNPISSPPARSMYWAWPAWVRSSTSPKAAAPST
jgi:hypothetical protein